MSTGSVCIYGRTKIGKTSDVLNMFQDAYVICTEAEALAPVTHQFGFTPAHTELLDSNDPYTDMLNVIEHNVRPAIASGAHTAVVMDSGTAFGSRLFKHLDRKFRSDGRKVYPKFDHQFRDVMTQLLTLPVWVVVIFHEQEPKASESRFVRGGPRTGGSASLVEDIGGMFRLVMRGAAVQGPGGIQRAYMCDSLSPQWVQGDAYGATSKQQPMDLRPIVWRIVRPDEVMPDSMKTPKPYRVVEVEECGMGMLGNGAAAS